MILEGGSKISSKAVFSERLISAKDLAIYLDEKNEWVTKKTINKEIPSIKTDDKVRYSASHVLSTIAESNPEKALEAMYRILENPVKKGEDPIFSCTTPLIRFISSELEKLQKDHHILRIAPPNWPTAYKSYLSKSNYGNGNFRINYIDNTSDLNCVQQPTDKGPHNVQLHDSYNNPVLNIGQTDPSNNVPSVVQEYGIRFEYALSRYVQAGFPNPTLPGHPIEVYIANINARGQTNSDKSIWLYSAFQPSTLAMEHCVNHEFFHLIQDLYYFEYSIDSNGKINAHQISSPDLEGFYFYLEGQAEWAPQLVNKGDVTYDVYYNMSTSSINPPEKWSLIAPDYNTGCKSSVFWKYYSEQLTSLSDPFIGADIIRKLWEYIQTQGNNYKSAGGWYNWTFETTLSEYTKSLFPEISLLRFLYNSQGQQGDFFKFTGYNQPISSNDIISNESLYGNWALAGICKELKDPVLDTRFGYMEQFQKTLSLALPSRTHLTTGQTSQFNIANWATQYFQLDISNPSSPLKFTINCNSATSNSADALVQLVMVDSLDRIVDIIKSVNPAKNSTKIFERIIGQQFMSGSKKTDIKKIFVLISTFGSAITGTVNATSVSPSSDIMITRWNSNQEQEYQINFKNNALAGINNDIYKSKIPMTKIVWVYDQRLKRWKQQFTWIWLSIIMMKIHNKGNVLTQKVDVNIDFQVVPRSFNLEDTIPYANGWYKSNDPPIELDVDANNDASNYIPLDFGDIRNQVKAKGITTATIFLRATITSSADTSTDNNVAITKFDLYDTN